MFRFMTALAVAVSLIGCQASEARGPAGLGVRGGFGVRGLGLNRGLAFNHANRFRFHNQRIVVVPQFVPSYGASFGYGAGLGCASYVPPVQTFAAAPCNCGAQTLSYGATYGAGGCNQAIGYGAGLGVGGCNAGFAGYGAGLGVPFLLRGHVFRGGFGHHHHGH